MSIQKQKRIDAICPETFNIGPDWMHFWTAAEANEQLLDFRFTGPGWYIGKTEAMLVVPIDEPLSRIGNQQWTIWRMVPPPPADRRYLFMFYSESPMNSLNALANAPVRRDDR